MCLVGKPVIHTRTYAYKAIAIWENSVDKWHTLLERDQLSIQTRISPLEPPFFTVKVVKHLGSQYKL